MATTAGRNGTIPLPGAGFSLVEILSMCPVNWKMGPLDACRWIDEVMVEEFPLGVFKEVPLGAAGETPRSEAEEASAGATEDAAQC